MVDKFILEDSPLLPLFDILKSNYSSAQEKYAALDTMSTYFLAKLSLEQIGNITYGNYPRYIKEAALIALDKSEAPEAPKILLDIFPFLEQELKPRSIHMLAKEHSFDVVPLLLRELIKGDPATREIAVHVLGVIQDSRSKNLLINALLNDSSPEVRTESAVALASFRDNGTIMALIKAIEDKNFEVNMAAAFALGEIGDETALPALIQAQNSSVHLINSDSVTLLLIIQDAIDNIKTKKLNQEKNQDASKLRDGLALDSYELC